MKINKTEILKYFKPPFYADDMARICDSEHNVLINIGGRGHLTNAFSHNIEYATTAKLQGELAEAIIEELNKVTNEDETEV